MGPGVAEKRRGLAGTGVWLLPHIFSALFTAHGYRKNWRQGLQNGGLKIIFRTRLCDTVSRCIHEILSIDWTCFSCINGGRDDGYCKRDHEGEPSYPAALRHEGQPYADIAQLGERRQSWGSCPQRCRFDSCCLRQKYRVDPGCGSQPQETR